MKTFTDDQGWYPASSCAGRWPGCSTATPTPRRSFRRWATLRTARARRLQGNRLPAYDGLDIGLGPFGSGNPADSGVGYGTVITVTKAMDGNRAALISITPPSAE